MEFGGTDQLFNLLVGRELQEKVGQRPQLVFTMPILPGTDGVRRMGKSLGNYIALEDTPRDMFGKIMSLPDDVIALYFELLTDVPDDELATIKAKMTPPPPGPLPRWSGSAPGGEVWPPGWHEGRERMDIKKRLADELTAAFHSTHEAATARAEFEYTFQAREVPMAMSKSFNRSAIPAVAIIDYDDQGFQTDLSYLLPALGMAASRSEARRLLQQNAVRINGLRPPAERMHIPYGALIQVGPQRFAHVEQG